MASRSHFLLRTRADEAGQTTAEYAVVLAVLTITTAAVFTALSGGVAGAVSSVTGVI